jgi:hypothetical protein
MDQSASLCETGKDHDGKDYYYLKTGDQLNTATRVATMVPHPPTP